MSWDVALVDPVTHEEIETDVLHDMRGGMYCIGGTTRLWLNVTYNYGMIFRRADVLNGSLEDALDGKQAVDTIPLLERAIANLGSDVSDDYWEDTEGNAKRALCKVLALAKMRPDAVWRVT